MQQHMTFPYAPLFSAIKGGFARSFRNITVAAALSVVALSPDPASAQNLFSTAIRVDDRIITHFEIEQRILFLRTVGTPGNLEERARNELIEDRLKLAQIDLAGMLPTAEDVDEGMVELAQRANLPMDEFLAALQNAGIDQETLRDFTRVGLGWRQYVAARFLARARPTEQEIDRAMGTAGSGSVEVLLSELIIPLTPQNVAQVEAFIDEVRKQKGFDAFSAAAAQASAADSRENGGRLPWVNLSNLPPQLQEIVLNLETGEITEPVTLQGAVALFQMRGIREAEGRAERFAAIEYATYFIPGGRSPDALARARSIRDQIDTCDDLYAIAKDQDPSVLEIQSLAPADIPRDIALELAKLDPGETSAVVTRNNGQTLALVMLCGRTAELGEGANRDTVANALTQQRLETLANSHLAQLRADARIVE
ncbi:peptidylprolyl isomerase [Epibacterium ulvae]|uniref:peptidylprolyl isomerase n=1 Tax=Epibacterium ulvae TaxID=1156985 RepID=UPI003F6F7946